MNESQRARDKNSQQAVEREDKTGAGGREKTDSCSPVTRTLVVAAASAAAATVTTPAALVAVAAAAALETTAAAGAFRLHGPAPVAFSAGGEAVVGAARAVPATQKQTECLGGVWIGEPRTEAGGGGFPRQKRVTHTF